MITPPTIRVLHVDDDKSFLTVSKQILADKGPFLIDIAFTVDDALTKLETQNYDVIISDYYLPFKTGLDLLKNIRERGLRIPFIIFTGKGREEIIVQALNLGADRFIDKLGEPEIVYTELSIAMKQIFEKAQAEKMLWESEERFKKMVINSNDLIMLTQSDGIILYISPACKKILGYAPEELEGKSPWVVHPEDTERIKKIFQLALSTESNGTAEYRIITKQGEIKWVNHSFSQIIENGKIKQLVSIVRDITEAKNSQTKLAETESKFSAAFYSSGAALSIATLSDGLFVDVNDSFLKLFGYTREEVIGKTVTQLNFYSNFNDRKKIINLIQRNKSIINREVVFRRKDSKEVIVLLSTKILNIRSSDHLLTTFIDITALKKTEKELMKSKKEVEDTISIAPYGRPL